MANADINNNLLDREQVSKAVHAIFQYNEKKEKKSDFLIEGEDIHMQLTFKKVPDVKNKTIKIQLPTTLLRESSDVCLFVKDLNKKLRDTDPTTDYFKELLSKKNVTNIAEVIPLKTLKLEYQPYEAKRNLSNMYDFFLADERIVRLLPNLLGKSFYARKRHPMSVDLQQADLKHEVDRVLTSTRLIIGGRGSSCQVTVAHTAMTEDQVVDNVLAAAQRLADTLPGGATNVRNLHLRMQDSPALPLYVSDGSVEDVTLPERKRKLEEDEPEEVSTVLDKKVKVTPTGDIQFYTQDGERIPDEKEIPEKGKRGGKRKKETQAQSKATPAKTAKMDTDKPKKTSSKVMRLAPKEAVSDKKLTKQNKEKKNKKAKSIQKKVAAKNIPVKSKPKSKKMKT